MISGWSKVGAKPLAGAVVSAMLRHMRPFDCTPALKALSEPIRLRIVQLLSRECLSVNEVAARLDLPQYQVSRQLQILREAGLLEMHSDGRKHRHKVPAHQLDDHGNILDLGCCAFRFDRLCR